MAPGSRGILLAVLSVIVIAGSVALGIWQVRWMQWQDRLSEQSRSLAGSEPATINDIEAGLEYGFDVNLLRVRLNGYYRHDLERYINAPKDGEPGYQVITPFIEELGYVVLVDRGWVGQAERAPANRSDPRKAEGSISITGITRINATSMTRTLPDADKVNNIWYWYDRRGVAFSLPAGLGESDTGQAAIIASLFVQIEPGGEPGDGRLPQISSLTISPSINHLLYAIVWFSLALMLTAMRVTIYWKRRRKK